jgi:DNA-binding transcriptional ArsR family regulator
MKSESKLDPQTILFAAKKFSVITHPVRVQIIQLLDENEKLNVTQIYTKINMPQPETSHHLAQLRRNNILKKVRSGKMSIYSLNKELIVELIKIAEELSKR